MEETLLTALVGLSGILVGSGSVAAYYRRRESRLEQYGEVNKRWLSSVHAAIDQFFPAVYQTYKLTGRLSIRMSGGSDPWTGERLERSRGAVTSDIEQIAEAWERASEILRRQRFDLTYIVPLEGSDSLAVTVATLRGFAGLPDIIDSGVSIHLEAQVATLRSELRLLLNTMLGLRHHMLDGLRPEIKPGVFNRLEPRFVDVDFQAYLPDPDSHREGDRLIFPRRRTSFSTRPQT